MHIATKPTISAIVKYCTSLLPNSGLSLTIAIYQVRQPNQTKAKTMPTRYI